MKKIHESAHYFAKDELESFSGGNAEALLENSLDFMSRRALEAALADIKEDGLPDILRVSVRIAPATAWKTDAERMAEDGIGEAMANIAKLIDFPMTTEPDDRDIEDDDDGGS